MKRLVLNAILLSAAVFLLNACASQETVEPSVSSGANVPGEKVDGGSVTPGAGPAGASANVRF